MEPNAFWEPLGPFSEMPAENTVLKMSNKLCEVPHGCLLYSISEKLPGQGYQRQGTFLGLEARVGVGVGVRIGIGVGVTPCSPNNHGIHDHKPSVNDPRGLPR